MVRIILPSLSKAKQAEPLFYNLEQGTKLYRIYRTKYYPTADSFRFWGPIHRFDHHRGNPARIDYKARRCEPCEDTKRGICYVAPKFSSCLVEVFGDTPKRAEITKEYWFAILTPKTDLMLLDLRNNGAMLAGANDASLAKTHRRIVSQAWSRLFYDYQPIYHEIQGMIYHNAHNNEEAIAFYERAASFLTYEPKDVMPLTDAKLRRFILKAAKDNNINVIFPKWLKMITRDVAS
ncbi:RES domain-containing protein [Tolypothrix campylonemoides VB511288]|nr:RES domain-containing protein [Tolypothrix campylonemoides VB511288]